MTRDEHDRRVLAIIIAHIGAVLPNQRTISAELGTSASRVNHSIARLQDAGKIEIEGLGNCRAIHVPGKGWTKPKFANTEVEGYQAAEEIPFRPESFSCPRCGARGGRCGHTAIALSSGRPGGWQRFAVG